MHRVTTAASTTDSEARGARARVFALSWIAYAGYYLTRKNFSVTKARIRHDEGVSPDGLAAIDTTYLTAYALGQFASGLLGDRFGSRRLLGAGMLASAVASVAFGLSSTITAFALAFGFNGLAQSTGWPGSTRAMAAVTTPQDRGAVMGLWSTCYQVGGIAATALATALLARGGWRSAFLVPSLLVAVIGALVISRMPDADLGAAVGTVVPAVDREAARSARRRVFGSVHVWSYGLAYCAIKLIRYSLLFWLPYFLHEALHYSEGAAGLLSTSFEIGGIVGTITFGALTDRVRKWSRAMWSAASLVALAGALWLYVGVASSGLVVNFAAMALVGALLFGPDTVLSGCAAQDLGGREAAATATGLVNGLGSIGAIAQGAFTVGISRRFGWHGLFWGFVGLALLAAVALIPGILADLRRLRATTSVASQG